MPNEYEYEARENIAGAALRRLPKDEPVPAMGSEVETILYYLLDRSSHLAEINKMVEGTLQRILPYPEKEASSPAQDHQVHGVIPKLLLLRDKMDYEIEKSYKLLARLRELI